MSNTDGCPTTTEWNRERDKNEERKVHDSPVLWFPEKCVFHCNFELIYQTILWEPFVTRTYISKYRFTHCTIYYLQFGMKLYLGLWFHVYNHDVSAQHNNCDIDLIIFMPMLRTAKLSGVQTWSNMKNVNALLAIKILISYRLPFLVLIPDFLGRRGFTLVSYQPGSSRFEAKNLLKYNW